MAAINDLLEKYEKADLSERLNLYLQYRDLRHIFFEKERDIIHQEVNSYSPLQKTERDDFCYPKHAVQKRRSMGYRDRLLKFCPRCW